MTITTDDILAIIYDCVDDINRQLPDGVTLSKTPETRLFGEGGVLDSLGLITLLVCIEEALQAKRGIHCVILEEEAMANPEGQYHSIKRLADWIATTIASRKDI